MKTFFRTYFGKTILFLLCIICGVVFAGSVVATAIMYEENLFTNNKEAAVREITEIEFENICNDILYDYSYKNMKDCGIYEQNWECIVRNQNEEIVLYTYCTDDGEIPTGDFEFTAKYVKLKDDVYFYGRNGSRLLYEKYEYVNPPEMDLSEILTIKGRTVGAIPVTSEYGACMAFLDVACALQYWIFGIMALSFIFGIIFFIMLMCVSARRPGTEELHPGILNKVPYDILIVCCVAICCVWIVIIDEVMNAGNEFGLQVTAIIGFGLTFLCLGLGMCMGMAARVKQGTLFSNTVTGRILKLVFKPFVKLFKIVVDVFKNLGLVWKSVIIIGIIFALDLIFTAACGWELDNMLIYWFISRAILIPIILYAILSMRRLEKTGEALSSGDLEYHTNTEGLIGPLKKHGENLNNIASGMQMAVEERIKSERMKTELITNVSHDIKTPLTSIINYASLISEEECENEKIHEYSDVLMRQSERLKRLIEDLVEASKASTGNLEVELVECDPANFIVQAAGEYEEKFEAAGLSLVVHSSDKEAVILADGRRMWRIFDNLMNNICKYAQTGTRVFLTMDINDKNVLFIFKNTSKEALDMTESELMERFVRGDKSRNTEGNGLGLSIAKSLAELQNGNLKLVIDGDLFKAILTFPRVR